MASCAIALQELQSTCHNYSITIDVNFNALKSFYVAFTPNLFKLRFPKLNINTAFIPHTDSIKYLGFTFTNSHKDDNDMLPQMRMLYACSNRLVRLFHSCSRNVLIELGKSFCDSFYCSYPWTHYNKESFSKIRVAYNYLYRKSLHVSRRSSASAMFVNNSILTFECLIRRDTFFFTSRLNVSTNKLINTIENCWLLKYVIWKPLHVDILFL